MSEADGARTTPRSAWPPRVWIACVATGALAAATLVAMGRPLWCRGGEAWLWAGDVWSRHNSQHLLDPYTLTHVSHGVIYYAVLAALLGRVLSVGARLVVAVGIESLWEVVENTRVAIERYRTVTMSLDYYGDSVANSLGDILACISGYLAAAWLPVPLTVAALAALEALLAVWIRDGLVLNVVMLLHPLEAIRAWQLEGMRRGG